MRTPYIVNIKIGGNGQKTWQIPCHFLFSLVVWWQLMEWWESAENFLLTKQLTKVKCVMQHQLLEAKFCGAYEWLKRIAV